jgi:phosphate/sulfate permease
VNAHIHKVEALMMRADTTVLSLREKKLYKDVRTSVLHFSQSIATKFSANEIPMGDRFDLRKDIIRVTKGCDRLITGGNLTLSFNEIRDLSKEIKSAKKLVEFAPRWVIILISICLGAGTMVGWKRIVKTVGEKIGKQHMSYAQGASAEIVASAGIGLASWQGLPVSTTHMLSSGVAGSMVAKKGLKNLQKGTVKTIAITWLLTLPATIILSGGLFLIFRAIL